MISPKFPAKLAPSLSHSHLTGSEKAAQVRNTRPYPFLACCTWLNEICFRIHWYVNMFDYCWFFCMCFRFEVFNLFLDLSLQGISLKISFITEYIIKWSNSKARTLIHWPLRDAVETLKVLFPNTCYRLSSWALLVEENCSHVWMPKTPFMISQHWYRRHFVQSGIKHNMI